MDAFNIYSLAFGSFTIMCIDVVFSVFILLYVYNTFWIRGLISQPLFLLLHSFLSFRYSKTISPVFYQLFYCISFWVVFSDPSSTSTILSLFVSNMQLNPSIESLISIVVFFRSSIPFFVLFYTFQVSIKILNLAFHFLEHIKHIVIILKLTVGHCISKLLRYIVA